jgi:pyruvate dehydrogenase complex dehydrogenase (E1) component
MFARDRTGALVRAFAHTVDGQFQTFSANDGAYNRFHWFIVSNQRSNEERPAMRRA